MTAEDVMTRAMSRVRAMFYKDADRFSQDRDFLIRALTFPANWLHTRGVRMPAAWHAEILKRILDEVQKHRTRETHFFPGYLLRCIQAHMDHNGERYYDAAKEHRTVVGQVVSEMRKQAAPDTATDVLAEAHRIASRTVDQQRRKPASRETQKELF
ncbi:MAG TPA: hypothetical protein VFV83_08785 [Chthoniobacteraceae bacterium]|nr:hypothetical protein [Chthoniobacteraceae bacterium]